MQRFIIWINIIIVILLLINVPLIQGLFQRCYHCRSRGDLGTCKDPFTWNVTNIADVRGVEAVPCSSGWCGKLIESESALSSNDDYDKPTQRMCIQRGPSDSEDRCAFTMYNYKRVYMCFCQGDLCNAAVKTAPLNGITFVKLSIFMGFLLIILNNNR